MMGCIQKSFRILISYYPLKIFMKKSPIQPGTFVGILVCVIVLAGIYAFSYKAPSVPYLHPLNPSTLISKGPASEDCGPNNIEMALKSAPTLEVSYKNVEEAEVEVYQSTEENFSKYGIQKITFPCQALGADKIGSSTPLITGKFKINKLDLTGTSDAGYVDLPITKPGIYYVVLQMEGTSNRTGIFMKIDAEKDYLKLPESSTQMIK